MVERWPLRSPAKPSNFCDVYGLAAFGYTAHIDRGPNTCGTGTKSRPAALGKGQRV